MPIDLEALLASLCEAEEPRMDLATRLSRVKTAAYAIWSVQLLHWFTDHRAATHSRRVVSILSSMTERLQETGQALSRSELYILLAAAYLHDIGMQDFRVDSRGPEELVVQDYEFIRDRHPERGRRLIIARTLQRGRDEFEVGLDDDTQYLVPIALVAQGHGNAFFETTARELERLPHRPENKQLRGSLLTALLLMADELDIHESRATFPKEMGQSAIVALHHHINHYVTGTEVVDGETPKRRRIRIEFEFPADSGAYADDVSEWVIRKLAKQTRRTHHVIEDATQGETTWDGKIAIRRSVDRYGTRRRLPDAARLLLRSRLALERLVDREGLVSHLERLLEDRARSTAVLWIGADAESDWLHVADWIGASGQSRGFLPVTLSFEHSIGHSPAEVVAAIGDKLVQAGLQCPAYDTAHRAGGEARHLLETLLADLEGLDAQPPVILVVEYIDQADPVTRNFVVKELVALLSASRKPNVVLVVGNKAAEGEQNARGTSFDLGLLSENTIREYLEREMGYRGTEAAEEARQIHTMTGGIPYRVHLGLEIGRQRGILAER